MCWFCETPVRLSRRSFGQGVLAAAAAPGCLTGGVDDIVEPAMRLVVPDGGPRTVTLTLDACGGAADLRIIQTLLDLSVPATIFVTGLWLRGNASALGLLRGRPELFSLQNHGALHLPPVLGTRRVYGLPVAGTLDAVRHEVERGAELVAATGSAAPRWYRGAAALYSPAALGLIQGMGVAVAGFSLSGDQGASLPAASVARRIGAAVSGDVIIAHVNQPGRPSGTGVAEGVTALRRAGVVFVGLDALPVTELVCGSRGGRRVA